MTQKEQLLSDSFRILASDLMKKKNIDGLIKYKMKKMYEKKCSKNGYVIPDTLEILRRSIGEVISVNNKSYINYNVNYKIQTILPCKDDIYESIIDSITHMGVIAYLNYKDNKDSSIKDSPLLIIIPKEYFDETHKISDMSVGQKRF